MSMMSSRQSTKETRVVEVEPQRTRRTVILECPTGRFTTTSTVQCHQGPSEKHTRATRRRWFGTRQWLSSDTIRRSVIASDEILHGLDPQLAVLYL